MDSSVSSLMMLSLLNSIIAILILEFPVRDVL